MEVVAGPDALVVDIGCGTGTVTRRIVERLPSASVIAVDIDPVLLAIASATFSGDERVRIVPADLREEGWSRGLADRPIDAVVTVTALHWLSKPVVQRLYRDVAALLRSGGLFAHSELMPLVDTPRLADAMMTPPGSRTTWDRWWESAAADPRLAAAFAQRRSVFQTTYPIEEFSPPASWHRAALLDAGFAEAGVVYRDLGGAIVAAIR